MDKYQAQAVRMTQFFQERNVSMRVWKVTLSKRLAVYQCTFADKVRISAVQAMATDLKVRLGVPSVNIVEIGGAVHIEVAREGTTRRVALTEVLPKLSPMPPYTAALGLDAVGNALGLRLDSPDIAHIFIAGTTGSGKSVLLRTLLLSLQLSNNPGLLKVILLDPKGAKSALLPLQQTQHRWRGLGLLADTHDIAVVLRALVLEMERRDRKMVRLPHLVIAIDELAELIELQRANIITPLQRLTQRGRDAGMHVIAATQRPSATLVGGMMKANFPTRLVGSVTSSDDARVAAGIPDTGAERLLGSGDFLLIAKGQTLRFQAATVQPHELQQLLDAASRVADRARGWTEQRIASALRQPVVEQGAFHVEQPDLRAALGDLLLVGDRVGGREGAASMPARATVTLEHTPAQPAPSLPSLLPPPAPRAQAGGPGSQLRARFSLPELYAAYLLHGSAKKASAALFGYVDSTTLQLFREAKAWKQASPAADLPCPAADAPAGAEDSTQ